MPPQAVRDYLATHRQQFETQLMELLRIPSVANVREDPHPCDLAAGWLRDHLAALGLDAAVRPTAGQPVVLARGQAGPDKPTVLVYGHYDVQPPDPLGPWTSPPFEPTIRDGRLYARGANDNKGQLFTHLMALEAWIRAGGGLPCNVVVLLEGEEEIGSPTLEPFLAEHADELACDACIISDSEFFAPGVPSLTYALRGLAYFEVTFTGAAADAHSGIHGGALGNPAHAAAKLVAALFDHTGRVTLEGFYDDVVPLAADERDGWNALPFDEAAYAASLGVDALSAGEDGFSVLERRWARPTLDVNGLVSGYTEEGSKTIIPASATVKLSTRLVPHQDPDKIVAAMEAFVAAHTPAGMTSRVDVHATARPVMLDRHAPAFSAGAAAMEEAFDAPAAYIRCGASVPVTEMIQRLLGVDAVLMGFGLPDDNLHSPNEKFDLEQLHRGAIAAASWLGRIASR